MSWEELEHGFWERIKSVLVLVLFVIIMVMQVRITQAEKAGKPANPIDTFFVDISKGGEELSRNPAYQLIYLECWEQELSHAYQCLEERISSGQGITLQQVTEAEACFREFAGWQGWLETCAGNAPVEEQDIGEKAQTQLELMRALTLRIYGMLGEEEYLFQETIAEEMLKNSGWQKQ